MTTFEKTWTTVVNQNVDGASSDTNSTAAEFMFQLYTMLTGVGAGAWTVQKACNGVNYADDDTYTWTSASDVVFGYQGTRSTDGSISGDGTVHSWIELKSPDNFPTTGKNLYLFIDCASNQNPNLTDGYTTIALGTVTATAATGTTLRRPTLPDGTWWSANGYRSTAYWSTSRWQRTGETTTSDYMMEGIPYTLGYDAANPNYFHGGRTTEGAFFFHGTRQGYGYGTTGGMVMNLDTPRSIVTDPWPVVSMFGRVTNNSPGFFGPVTVNRCNNNSTNCLQSGMIQGRTFLIDGTNRSGNYSRIILCSVGAYSNIFAPPQQQAGGNAMDSKYMAIPIWVLEDSNGYDCVRGRLVDIRHGPKTNPTTSVLQATVEPSTGPIESYLLGGFWWPGDAPPIV